MYLISCPHAKLAKDIQIYVDGGFGLDATGSRTKKYLVLATEDLTNQVKGRALTNKTTSAVCRFLLEEVVCRYGCVGNVVVDRGELDAHEAIELFE